MKDMLIDMMVTMMPLMKPLMWFAVGMALLGITMLIAAYAFKLNTHQGITWSARLVLATALFFLAAQMMGYMLNMPPTFNMGDAEKFEFILVSFWKVGGALLIAGLLLSISNRVGKGANG